MKKKLILIPLIFISLSCTALPNGWVLTIFNQSYVDLTNPTVAPLSNGWDNPNLSIPLGFFHNALGQMTDTMYTGLSHGGVLFTSKVPPLNMYTFGVDVIDRTLFGTPNPPATISYQTTGINGNRIAKIQYKNFGFKGEYITEFTLKDSGNIQVWFYELDNSIEYRFGTSLVSNLQRNVQGANLQLGIISSSWLYYVDSLSPTVLDSTTNTQAVTGTYGIASYPTNGTVIRFGPTTVGIDGIVKLNDNITFYPTLASNNINIDFSNELKGNENIKILNMNGNLVANKKINNKRNIIDVSYLANGNYILNVQQNNQSVFYKFTKN